MIVVTVVVWDKHLSHTGERVWFSWLSPDAGEDYIPSGCRHMRTYYDDNLSVKLMVHERIIYEFNQSGVAREIAEFYRSAYVAQNKRDTNV